ncbi:DUF4870 domain-containing protein [Actinocorallia sp. A-T 12471]|uniref:DUF4870 domain-containing protein n=1 Tax=Actinocorallia sp. A-T 12471 TaxID=3089813 RepID=UPI0029CC88CD|nr:DUF4870 domain-containing protein [Actinocorallia sp. A-T 12471]MDX6743487.1 DUF4870 domain-containing protein [Actinocorallia sp. A-T 12471]
MSTPPWDPNAGAGPQDWRQQHTQPPFPPSGGYQPPGGYQQGGYPGGVPQGGYQPPYGQPPLPPQGFPPYPQGPTSEDTTWSLLGYLGQFLFGVFAPLVVFLMYKDRSPFVRWHAAQSLNLGIAAIGYSLILIPVTIVTLGLGALLYIPLGIAEIIYLILAAVGASRGEWYRFPAVVAWPLVR